jgi:hypothetical protein
MTKTLPVLLFTTLLSAPPVLLAGGRGDAIWGAAVGGAVGAAIGSELGGRDGAIVGSAIGATTGAAAATRHHHYYDSPRYRRGYAHRDYGPPPAYYYYRHGRDRGYHSRYRDWE